MARRYKNARKMDGGKSREGGAGEPRQGERARGPEEEEEGGDVINKVEGERERKRSEGGHDG